MEQPPKKDTLYDGNNTHTRTKIHSKSNFYFICCDHRFSTSMSTVNPWLAHFFLSSYLCTHWNKRRRRRRWWSSSSSSRYVCFFLTFFFIRFALQRFSVKTFKFNLYFRRIAPNPLYPFIHLFYLQIHLHSTFISNLFLFRILVFFSLNFETCLFSNIFFLLDWCICIFGHMIGKILWLCQLEKFTCNYTESNWSAVKIQEKAVNCCFFFFLALRYTLSHTCVYFRFGFTSIFVCCRAFVVSFSLRCFSMCVFGLDIHTDKIDKE